MAFLYPLSSRPPFAGFAQVLLVLRDQGRPMTAVELTRKSPSAGQRGVLDEMCRRGLLTQQKEDSCATAIYFPGLLQESSALLQDNRADIDAAVATLAELESCLALRKVAEQRRIKLLHIFNETKDAVGDLFGKLADATGGTVSDLYSQHGLS